MGGAALLLVAVAGADVEASGQVATQTPSHASGDIDGDGSTDHVYGYPSWNSGRGAVVVVTGGGNTSQFVNDYASLNDYFGDSVSVGDIDGDGFDDVVVGTPGDWVSGLNGAGSIRVFYGSNEGLSTVGDQLVSRNSAGIEASAEVMARFGETVAMGDFNCDGYDDVAVGAPLDNAHANRTDDGSVNVIYGSSGGLSTVDATYHQGTSGVSGAPENGDQFGGALAVGNFNGDDYSGTACEDLAVGSPGEGADRGFVVFFYGDRYASFLHSGYDLDYTSRTGLSQNTGWASDLSENDDVFGAVMWSYPNAGVHDDLLVGVPGEVCTDGTRGGIHRFWGSDEGVVVDRDLVTTLDQLECFDGPGSPVPFVSHDYRECMDRSGIDCLATAQQTLDAGLLNHTAITVACLNALDYASERCEHWISDPVCDVDACISATLELNAMANECAIEGDILPRAYPI